MDPLELKLANSFRALRDNHGAAPARLDTVTATAARCRWRSLAPQCCDNLRRLGGQHAVKNAGYRNCADLGRADRADRQCTRRRHRRDLRRPRRAGLRYGLWCELDPGTCKRADAEGRCARVPHSCGLSFRAVCACGGQTFSSDCRASGPWLRRTTTDLAGSNAGAARRGRRARPAVAPGPVGHAGVTGAV